MFERDLTRLRFVTHPLVGDAEIEQAAAIVADVVERHAVPPAEEPEVEGLDEYLAWEAEQIEAIEQGPSGRSECRSGRCRVTEPRRCRIFTSPELAL